MHLHFALGALRGIVISDGQTSFSPNAFFVNADPAERAAVLAARGEGPDIPAPLNCLLLDVDGRRVLIEAGMGPAGRAGTGRLLAHMAGAGVDPASIDTVILTHLHPDHADGMVTAAGQSAFPGAEVIVSQAAWDALALPAPGEPFYPARHHCLHAVQGQIRPVTGDPRLTPSIRVAPAPGHAPGQLTVLVTAGETRLLHAADVIAHPLHLEYPDWNVRADIDRIQAVTVRRRLLGWAAREGVIVFGYHFPFPGFGRVVALEGGAGWRWQPVTGDLKG
ncbi:MAG: MBL fold metallo-hydrolase [Anaerolineae bacterium]|nr:MBL fold metallo-hydrolase [Anaerolineae bacterium]